METTQTWHYGLVAEWWANFNTDGPEIDYFGRLVERAQPESGVPARELAPRHEV